MDRKHRLFGKELIILATNKEKGSYTNEFGGIWTEVKLQILESYAQRYLTVFKNQPWQKLLYFDGFAGSGDIKIKNKFELIEGASKRIIRVDEPRAFNMYYFVEKDKKLADTLSHSLKREFPNKRIFVVAEDCNNKIKYLAKFLRSRDGIKYKVLGFIDPKGMQLEWESLLSLKGLPIDLWILNPTNGANRLLKRNGNIREAWVKRLNLFLGIGEEEIKQEFYVTQKNIFGDDILFKERNAIDKLQALYDKRLKGSIFEFTTNAKRLCDEKGQVLFHFFMASNEKIAINIANSVINPKLRL